MRSPLSAASRGTPKPAVHTVKALGSTRPSDRVTESSSTRIAVAGACTSTPSLRSRLAAARRAGSPTDGNSCVPQMRVTRRPASASSPASSTPVRPAPTTTMGASGASLSYRVRTCWACSNSLMDKAYSATPGTSGVLVVLPTA
ncbi:Uncharacterised protein [Mycobacteroides abscessus subsp. abscessus]|nr:Uncharacterised protein [Mycobacteroides abscessus subsp. abscessus]